MGVLVGDVGSVRGPWRRWRVVARLGVSLWKEKA